MQLPCTRNCRRLPRVPANLWVCVGFEGGFGPKGLGNSAQALAWQVLFLRASPVRAPDNAGAIPYRPHRNSDDYLLRPFSSSNPAWRVFFTVGAPKQRLMRAVAFIVTPPRLKPGLSSQDPSGR